ncbi:hypothetical protein LB465_00135 [Salegentibacter sp. LM13S]|uniref:hypothetical protein n=1 Tax=Salegentibacter lacus TaxID=2873599 RepID=UPI001CCBB041|nr:hypothetical protein [Salegentibacter lacus]MBZ9629166.1 hypothetical protein [Salegentibacter lacus]
MVAGKISLDSCLLRIPYEDVRVNKESGICDTWVHYNVDTQEMEDSERSKRLIRELDGYEIYFSLQDKKYRGYAEHYLVMTLNAKILEHQYLEGITIDNIRKVYDKIQYLDIVHFDFDVFLNKSICTDVEIKQDFVCTNEVYDRMKNEMKRATPLSQKLNIGYMEFNTGITWNRRAQAPVSHPFVELYDKHEEIQQKKNQVFKSKFLSGANTHGLRRIEFNLKNKKHFTRYEIFDCSLFGILSLTDQRKNEIKQEVLGRVVDFRKVKQNIVKPQLPPAQQMLFELLKSKLDSGQSYSAAIEDITASLNANNAFKYRVKFEDLYKEYFCEVNAGAWMYNTPLQFILEK